MRDKAEQALKTDKTSVSRTSQIRMGFHAVPSMTPLHLHIISDDFHAPALKTKKHWNSFSSDDFFLNIDQVIQRLERGEPARSESIEYHEQVLKRALVCCHCGASMKTIPTLKQHLEKRFLHEQFKCPTPK
jgi:aprataxin